MSLVLNTNLSSLNAQRALTGTQNASQTAMQRLSSGLRVNSAKDDAAGLSIGTKMGAQVRGLNQAVRNANDGISMLQVADGTLSTIGDMMLRMRDLAVQAANGTNGAAGDAAYDALSDEYDALATAITDMAAQTKFNGKAVIDADAGTTTLQIGANSSDTYDITTPDAGAYSLGAIATGIDDMDTALDTLNADRASIGVSLNNLDFVVSNLQNSAENTAAAKSRIMDADYSAESANLAKAQVLQQAGIAMVAQANQQPQQILSLLR